MHLAHRLLFTIGLLVCLPGATCDSSETGAGGSGGQVPGSSDCQAYCAQTTEPMCPTTSDEAKCMEECEGTDAIADAGSADCSQAWTDYKSCMTGATVTCLGGVGEGFSKLPCRDHWDHTYNYCTGMLPASTPCMDATAFASVCEAMGGPANAKVCPGDVPSGCVIGGNDSNADLYCCP